MPTFSVIVPVKPGMKSAAISAIYALSYNMDCIEILLAEGSAPSLQRNLAAREAAGEILYFLDDDSIINSDNLNICSLAMEDTSVAVVGGSSVTPATDSWIQKLFGVALASLFGSGAVRNRYRIRGVRRETTEKELILCNLAVRRSVFVDMNGFDERLYPNEENELLNRINRAGFKLLHIPEMHVFRSQRSSLTAFIRQMFVYGRGRAQQTMISGIFSFVSFVPLFFVFYLISVLFFISNPIMFLPLSLYLILNAFFTMSEFVRSGTIISLGLVLIYPLMHIVNGVGLFAGLLSGKPTPLNDPNIIIKKIKSFGISNI